VKNQSVIALLAQVACHHVPSESAAASNDERLRVFLALQYLSEQFERLSKDIHKRHPDM
jgi:hypothetical protein